MLENNEDYLSPKEVAKILKVSPVTVRLWAQKGELNFLSTPGGHRRFLRSDVQEFADRKYPSANSKLKLLFIGDEDVSLSELEKQDIEANAQVNVNVAESLFSAGMQVKELRPDAVLINLTCEKMDGLEVCKTLKQNKQTKNIKVIGVTNHLQDENYDLLSNVGFLGCIESPINKQKLEGFMNLGGPTN